MKIIKGLTFWIAFGSIAKPNIWINKKNVVISLCLGFVRFSIFKYNVEGVLSVIMNENLSLKRENEILTRLVDNLIERK